MYINYKKARFIRYEGRRFKCLVELDGEEVLCYIASSSSLCHYLEIENKEILITENKSSKCRLQYRVLAVQHKSEWIIIDLQLLNHVIKEKFISEGKVVESEKKIGGYKADLLIVEEKKTVVCEIKSILCSEGKALFPMNAGKRCAEQLMKLSQIVTCKEYEVMYIFVLLCQETKIIEIASDIINYKQLFSECCRKGMETTCFSISLQGNEVSANSENEVMIMI